MHIPDGFISPATAAVTAALAAAGVALALRRVRRDLPPRKVPLIGLVAAFVFAAQMLNFPVAAGTSGHLIGAVLATVLIGPAAAIVAMTAVLLLQCFMFADGGVTALGANVLNMAVLAPLAGHAVHGAVRRLAGDGLRGTLVATGFAAWAATVIVSLACAVELAASGTADAGLVIPAMGGVHMLIGLGEAVITMLVVAVVARARPELVATSAPTEVGAWPSLVRGGLIASLALAIGLAPFASAAPDGLEWVAERLSFAGRAAEPHAAPLTDYAVTALQSQLPLVSTAVAGAIGTLVAFVVAWVVARSLTPRERQS